MLRLKTARSQRFMEYRRNTRLIILYACRVPSYRSHYITTHWPTFLLERTYRSDDDNNTLPPLPLLGRGPREEWWMRHNDPITPLIHWFPRQENEKNRRDHFYLGTGSQDVMKAGGYDPSNLIRSNPVSKKGRRSHLLHWNRTYRRMMIITHYLHSPY